MVVTDFGKESTAALIGGSLVGSMAYMAIGSGSGTFSAATTGLVHEMDRNALTSTDFSTVKQIEIIGDWGASEISGISIRQFGTFAISSGGKCWGGDGFPAVSFDGTNELQIQMVVKVV